MYITRSGAIYTAFKNGTVLRYLHKKLMWAYN